METTKLELSTREAFNALSQLSELFEDAGVRNHCLIMKNGTKWVYIDTRISTPKVDLYALRGKIGEANVSKYMNSKGFRCDWRNNRLIPKK